MSYYEATSPSLPWPNNANNARQSWDTRSNGSANNSYQRSYMSDTSDAHVRPSSAHSFTKSEEIPAFGSQLDEVDRAVDNLVKSGKLFTARRESMPGLSGPSPINPAAHQHRMAAAMAPRPYSGGANYDELIRSQSAASLQNFYANQRGFTARPTDQEQVVQQKRRLAAARERDLRNYHQEQQYNRTLLAEMTPFGPNSAGASKERVVSPGAMSEEDRRELIASQHRALYGGSEGVPVEEGYIDADGHTPRASNPSSAVASNAGSVAGGTRGPSPFDPFGYQNGHHDAQLQPSVDRQPANNGPSPARSRTNSVQAQSSRTSASSPGGSPPRLGRVSTTPVPNTSVGPIGTRPMSSQNQSQQQSQSQNQNMQKRSTTPLPSPLGYGLHQAQSNTNSGNSNEESLNRPIPNERSSSAASNHTATSSKENQNSNLGWGNKVWGNNKSINNLASVWG